MNDIHEAVRILLVEDNAGDVRLTQEALKEAKFSNTLHVVGDGVEALAYLRQEGKFSGATRPHMVMLDLNMPRMDGREVLEAIKKDPELMRIPVVVLTSSEAESDIAKAYELHANAYVTKPVGIDHFMQVVKSIEEFWVEIVKLPAQ
jgi:two-component system, chemotaxis family, response regulator Rcp1